MTFSAKLKRWWGWQTINHITANGALPGGGTWLLLTDGRRIHLPARLEIWYSPELDKILREEAKRAEEARIKNN